MVNKYFLVLSIVATVLGLSHGQMGDRFFRSDYKYLKDTESFYKIFTLPKTWKDAKVVCEREGADLFYPEDEEEASVVINFWNQTQPVIPWIFIGVSDWNVKEVFETIDGRSISDVYNAWAIGEPNNAGGVEGCVVMRKEGILNDDNCRKRIPFICKKTLSSLQWNSHCDLPDPGYAYHPLLERCYKFHLTPRNWTEAYAVCRAEQSYLAIINSQIEADHLVNLTANAPKDDIKGDYLRGAVHLGFRNEDGNWITTAGVLLHLSGYNGWGYGQPDGGDKEKCGSMFYNGQLNDIGCFHRMFFICEHEMNLRTEDIALRFNIPVAR